MATQREPLVIDTLKYDARWSRARSQARVFERIADYRLARQIERETMNQSSHSSQSVEAV